MEAAEYIEKGEIYTIVGSFAVHLLQRFQK